MKILKLGLGVFGVAVAAGVLMFGVLGFGTAGAAPGPGGGGKQRFGDMQAALAAKLGISVDTLKAAQTAARNQLIDDAVGAGKLTQAQAQALKSGQPPAPGSQGTPGQGKGKGGLKFGNLGVLRTIMKDYDTVLAQRLGITPQQLQSAQMGARDQLLDAAVAAGKLTQDQANKLKSGQRPNLGGQGPFRGGNGAVVQGVRDAATAAASVLNMTPQDLQAQLHSGKSLAEIAQSKGIARTTLRSGILGAIQTDVNNALQAGKITATQSTEIINRLSKGLDQLLDRKIGQQRGANNNQRPGGQPQPGKPSTFVQPRGA